MSTATRRGEHREREEREAERRWTEKERGGEREEDGERVVDREKGIGWRGCGWRESERWMERRREGMERKRVDREDEEGKREG